MGDISILHLSDIHAGPNTYSDMDGKAAIKGVDANSPLDLLGNYVRALPKRPDFVVVSGDITIKGDRQGLEQTREWLLRQCRLGLLPQPEKILVVPGNHDIKRRSRASDNPHDQFRNFWEIFGRTFPHATIPFYDPASKSPIAVLKGTKSLGGISTRLVAGEAKLEISLPYVVDLESDVLIYAFNSAHGCGLPLTPDQAIDGKLASLIDVLDGSTKDVLVDVRNRYLDSLVVDAGMLTDIQITAFNEHMVALRKALPEKFDHLTKIAVLHHHIGHLWQQQLEVKVFEAVIDAAKFKQALTENSFDIVLHGHKHTNHVSIDGSLIPVDRTDQFSPLCVVSGGTIGGHPRTNDRQSFKLLELTGGGPRRAAMLREVPLLPANLPGEIIVKEARVYNLPLANRFPSLHDLAKIKDAVDIALVARLAPELVCGVEVAATGAKLTTAHPELFSDTYPYRCYAYTDGEGGKRFYEVVQATRALKFGTIARLQWLVSSVARISKKDRPAKAIILIGNLEKTHYSEAREAGETELSIADLKKWLTPAEETGYVEIRSLSFLQVEVADIAKAIAS